MGPKGRLKTCTVEGCSNPHSSLGLCRAHYIRQKRHGTVDTGVPVRVAGGSPLLSEGTPEYAQVVREVASLYTDQLWSSQQLAKHFGCSTFTILKVLKANNTPVRPRSAGSPRYKTPIKHHLPVEELTRLYTVEKWSAERIGEKFGCTMPTVLARLRKAGVAVRASNDTKRGAQSPHLKKPTLPDGVIVQLYENDPTLTVKMLAKMANATAKTIANLLRQHNVPLSPIKNPTLPESLIVTLYSNNPQVTMSQLAKMSNCTVDTIKSILDKHEIDRKPYRMLIGDRLRGANHPKFDPTISHEDRIIQRRTPQNFIWRRSVYERDKFTCKKCYDSRGRNLNAHHIENYKHNPHLRFEVSNGITFCEKCHIQFHQKYGKNCNRDHLLEFIGGMVSV